MKRLVALMMCAVSLGAAAQFPSLPYNPDENGDMLIGVVDLQALLANYGQEFSSAVVSEDGESAVVYMGEMTYPHCKANCDQLPGFWSLPKMEELIPVWSQVYTTSSYKSTWLETPNSEDTFRYFYSGNGSGASNHRVYNESYPAQIYRCYCAAKQLPRVEYSYCYSQGLGWLEECSNSKTPEGWYPMGGAATSTNSGSTASTHFVQAFWRWAE